MRDRRLWQWVLSLFFLHCSASIQHENYSKSDNICNIWNKFLYSSHSGPALCFRVHNSILISHESSPRLSLDAGCGQYWLGRMFRHKQVSDLGWTESCARVEEWTDKQASKQTVLSYLLLTDCNYVEEYIFHHGVILWLHPYINAPSSPQSSSSCSSLKLTLSFLHVYLPSLFL